MREKRSSGRLVIKSGFLGGALVLIAMGSVLDTGCGLGGGFGPQGFPGAPGGGFPGAPGAFGPGAPGTPGGFPQGPQAPGNAGTDPTLDLQGRIVLASPQAIAGEAYQASTASTVPAQPGIPGVTPDPSIPTGAVPNQPSATGAQISPQVPQVQILRRDATGQIRLQALATGQQAVPANQSGIRGQTIPGRGFQVAPSPQDPVQAGQQLILRVIAGDGSQRVRDIGPFTVSADGSVVAAAGTPGAPGTPGTPTVGTPASPTGPTSPGATGTPDPGAPAGDGFQNLAQLTQRNDTQIQQLLTQQSQQFQQIQQQIGTNGDTAPLKDLARNHRTAATQYLDQLAGQEQEYLRQIESFERSRADQAAAAERQALQTRHQQQLQSLQTRQAQERQRVAALPQLPGNSNDTQASQLEARLQQERAVLEQQQRTETEQVDQRLNQSRQTLDQRLRDESTRLTQRTEQQKARVKQQQDALYGPIGA